MADTRLRLTRQAGSPHGPDDDEVLVADNAAPVTAYLRQVEPWSHYFAVVEEARDRSAEGGWSYTDISNGEEWLAEVAHG